MRRAFRLGFGEGHIGREVDDELGFHVEMRTRKLVEMGLPLDSARAEALRQFGDLSHTRKACVILDEERERTMKRIRYADELRQDLGFALRALRRNPAFALIAVLTLALGVGANTAIFTLIDAVLLRPIPVAAPEQLVAIGDPAGTGSMSNGTPVARLISTPLYHDIRDNNHLVSGLLASGRTGRIDVRVQANGELEHPSGRFVSGNYFSVLGIAAARGRVFGATEDGATGASPVVVISDAYWTSRFARDPNVVGRNIVVDDAKLTIVGVTPREFTGEIVGRATDIWIPIELQPVLQPHSPLADNRNSSWLLLLGRLLPGVTLAQAAAGFPPLVRQMLVDHVKPPDTPEQVKKAEVPVGSGAQGFSRVRKTYSAPLVTMMAGVGLLLLIICANVANLLLARAVARTPEFSVRLAMGAGRGRLLRQLLTESAVLAAISAVAGMGIAWAGSRVLLTVVADRGAAIPLDLGLDLRVLGFTLGLSVLSVALFGLFPAIRASRLDLAGNLRARGVTGGLGARGQRFPIGRLMIAGQIALSLVMLMGAGLLVRSLRYLETTEVGLDRDHILMLSVDARGRGFTGDPLAELVRVLTERLQRIPGVTAVTYSENGVFSGTESNSMVWVPGWTGRTGDDSAASSDQVGPHYVAGLGARVLEGRDFTTQDAAPHGRHVALVNQSFARFYFGKQSALGRSFRLDDTLSLDIVGVIGEVRDHALDADPPRRFYTAYAQFLNGTPGEINFIIRGRGNPELYASAARAAVAAQDASLAIDTAQPLSVSMRQSITEQRLLARVASGFGLLALLLAAVGLYGVMTYAITRRTGEIGLRIALGAEPRAMVVMVLGDALSLVVVGVAAGVPLALLASRLLRAQLHGVGSTDIGSAGVALLVLTAAALVAAFVPARRAAKVAPLSALRQQ